VATGCRDIHGYLIGMAEHCPAVSNLAINGVNSHDYSYFLATYSVKHLRQFYTLGRTIGKSFWTEEFNGNIVRISGGYGPGIGNVFNQAMFKPKFVKSSRPITNFTFGYASKANVVKPTNEMRELRTFCPAIIFGETNRKPGGPSQTYSLPTRTLTANFRRLAQ
jgi:hypothetical protein